MFNEITKAKHALLYPYLYSRMHSDIFPKRKGRFLHAHIVM